jgi:putative SOS response-associated peptidase YedK
MCGRYGRRSDKQRIAEWAQAHDTNVFDVDESILKPSYNIAPQTFQPVVRLTRDTGKRELTAMRWGLIPYWSKDGKVAFSTINAKAETIASSPVFRDAFTRRRCLVPADLFYEWKKLDAKLRQPYAIAMKDGSIFAFAGLWERWKDRARGEALETYTVITTDPNELITDLSIHDRMPVILKPSDYGRWLQPGDPEQPPVDLLRPFDSDLMTAWKVAKDIGNVKNDWAGLCEPVVETSNEQSALKLFPDS